jgi:hypothetical protein
MSDAREAVRMSSNYRFRDVKSGQGPVNIGRDNRAAGRDYHDNRAWQHVDNRGGHIAGRDYHDRRAYVRHGDQYDIQAGPSDPFDAMASGRGVGRALAAIGMLIALAGFAGWAWIILSAMTSFGPDTVDQNPFAKTVGPGVPLAPVSFALAAVGGVLAAIGAAMAKAARRRHERRRRYQRPYY